VLLEFAKCDLHTLSSEGTNPSGGYLKENFGNLEEEVQIFNWFLPYF